MASDSGTFWKYLPCIRGPFIEIDATGCYNHFRNNMAKLLGFRKRYCSASEEPVAVETLVEEPSGPVGVLTLPEPKQAMATSTSTPKVPEKNKSYKMAGHTPRMMLPETMKLEDLGGLQKNACHSPSFS
jgi:hypothetical protein